MPALRIAAVLVLSVLALTGCTSAEAVRTRTEFAVESQYRANSVADRQRKIALFHIEENNKAELERLQAVLQRQNQRAGNNVERVSINYINYYGALEDLKGRLSEEYQVVESLYAEAVVLNGGFRQLSNMADLEIKMSQDTANAAILEAMNSANQIYAEWQRKNPAPVAGDEDGDDDSGDDEVEFVDEHGEEHADDPAPAPAPAPTPVPDSPVTQ